MELIALLIILALPIGAILAFATPVLVRGGPYVATSHPSVAQAIQLAQIATGEMFIDLGSGDGRLVVAAAQLGAHATGYETNPWLVLKSRRLIARANLTKKAHIIWGNLWRADLTKADVLSVFILPNLLADLEKKFDRELEPGTRVVTIGWPLPNWPIKKTIGKVFLYQKNS